MKQIIFIFPAIVLASCAEDSNINHIVSSECRGTYYSRSGITGELQKYDERYSATLAACVAVPKELTNFEKTEDERTRQNISCTPQPELPSMSLAASGNYYSARNNRYFIELNAVTGEYRTLTVGEYKDGRTVVERQVGCYYLRTDIESEPGLARNYGQMIMFGFEGAATSQLSGYDQIFNYTDIGMGFELVDPSPSYRGDWSYEFCPYQSVPWGFCDLIKAFGNILYLPMLTGQQKADLLSEAILIRSTYRFTKISSADFQSRWDQFNTAGTSDSDVHVIDEHYTSNWKYRISFWTDPNPYTSDAWIEYMKKERNYMPDLVSF